MYLREKLIKWIKIKNVVLAALAIFNLIFSVSWEIYLVIRYWGDFDTVIHAKATPEFVFWIIVGPIILIHVVLSKEKLGNAYFYSGYFEGDLDGFVSFEELADVMGLTVKKITGELNFLMKTYMKNFKCTEKGAELASKTITCECLSCAARIEKKMYFTGECPYCGSSDLRAKVVTGDRFYSISNELKGKPMGYEYYTAKNLKSRKALFAILMGLSMFVIAIMLMMGLEAIGNFGNEQYYHDLILNPDKHMQSRELITYDLIETVITTFFVAGGLVPVLINRIKRLNYVGMADRSAWFFTKCDKPFVDTKMIPAYRNKGEKKKINLIRQSMRKGYLRNCTLEKHKGILEVALGKKIVKDRCPFCAGAITGAVDKDYVCRYCGNTIMDVIVKK
ncbi:MAG: hydrogenase maturation nickel metallochaperone HypA [Lachnospiraceae bacterium]|nr:hydrogenase maturation nickel metallochaperone HypA [Lachnospiraceae bacterium]